jgi:penicillin amidase
LRRVALWSLGVVLVLVLVATIGMIWTVRRSMPGYSGELRLAGLSAPVTVYRDKYAIPQVYASTVDDLFKAQGYLHAQERFWEMDFRRHVTSGRVAELFGASEVDTDRYLRTMGWRRVAEQEWPLISPDSRRYLQDYADGVNAYLARNSGSAVSLEYAVLKLSNSGYRIAKWDPVDSLAWLKAMAWDLRGNMGDEIDRGAMLAAGLTREQIESLYPDYPYAENRPIVDGGTVTGGKFVASDVATAAIRAAGPVLVALERTALSVQPPDLGSNSFVISGRRTATGKPILANDPHLSPSMPGIWYQMGLHCSCDFNVEGFTFSGMPGVIIGHNGRIAWGFTNLDPDVTDLYLEQVRGDQYLVDGQWRDLAIRHETIAVAGAKPVPLTIRTTNNGPLLSDASDELTHVGNGYGVALRWTALEPGHTMDALFALDRAGDWTDFRAAAALFDVPSQNIVYADVDGNIGYQAPGRIPVRGKGDGRWPAPGWDSAYDWTGYVPFAALPNELNPARGYIATANQAVIDQRRYPYLLTDDWSYGYRSQRLADLIEQAGRGITVADAARMQFDSRNGFAAQIVPQLLTEPVTGRTAKALDLLRGWDFQQPADSAAAAFFNAFWRQLLHRTFDELPADRRPDGRDRWFLVVRDLLAHPDSPWWDDHSTSTVEHRDDIVRASLIAATGELSRTLGKDPAGWRWGRLHTLYLENQSFGKSGIGPIEWLFNYGPVGVPGGTSIVDATGWDASGDGYTVDAVPSMRMVVDMSTMDASRWIQLTGESGHAFSDHYHDQFDRWRTGGTIAMPWTEAAIRTAATDTLTLKP